MRGSVGEANRAHVYLGHNGHRSCQGVPIGPLRTLLPPSRRKRHRHHDGGTLCRRVLPSLPGARVMRPTPQHSGDHGVRRKNRCPRPRQCADRPAYPRRLCFDHRKKRATFDGLHGRYVDITDKPKAGRYAAEFFEDSIASRQITASSAARRAPMIPLRHAAPRTSTFPFTIPSK